MRACLRISVSQCAYTFLLRARSSLLHGSHVEGSDNRDANDGSCNNVMHFRFVLKLYKILPSMCTSILSFVKGNLLCRLSMLHFLLERRVTMFRSTRYTSPINRRSCVDCELSLHFRNYRLKRDCVPSCKSTIVRMCLFWVLHIGGHRENMFKL